MLKVLYCQCNLLFSWQKQTFPQGKTLASLRLGESIFAMKLTNGNTIKQHYNLCFIWFKRKAINAHQLPFTQRRKNEKTA